MSGTGLGKAGDPVDVVVIGAGIQGASTAFHLARAGLSVVVLERQSVASAATGRSSGLVRMHYDVAQETALAWASFQYFRNWSEMVEGDCGYVRTGFVRIVGRESETALKANVKAHQALGIPAMTITAADVARLAPTIDTSDFGLAAYEPESGYADPASTCQTLLAAARRHGAKVRTQSSVVGITVDAGRVTGVETTHGHLGCSVIVNAAGAWAGTIGAMVGLQLPVRAWHHHTVFIERPDPGRTWHPMVIDDVNAIYLRPEGKSLTLVGLEDGNVVDDRPDDETVGAAGFVDRAVQRICRRIPSFEDGRLHSTHGGTDGITPDQHPILGRSGPDGFVLQCGFSGTGFKTAPATGACIAELIADGKSRTADIGIFALERFASHKEIVAKHPYPPSWR